MQQNIVATQPDKPSKDVHLANVPDGYSPVGIIFAIAFLIGMIAKLIQVLVPVMMKDRNRK
jgi:hypothetical protein